jgi:glycosyltransferase involved in cell wall biosynthesis
MKFLIFSPYYPPHIGGLESHADEFNQHLAKANNTIIVFTPRLPINAPKKELLHDNKVTIIRYPAFEFIPNYPLPKFWSIKFWRLFFALYTKTTDITISRTRFFLTSFIALIFAKTKNTKFVHIEHGSDFVQLSSRFKSFIAKVYDYTFGWVVFKCSDLNISISEAVQKFVHKFDKRQSPVIYRGLDMKKIDIIPANQHIQKEYFNKIIITFVGRLYKWKGIENSIHAIRQLSPTIKNKLIFLIIGDGEDFVHLKKLSKNEDSIKMIGSIPREEAIGILKASSIYIHSAYPGGGLSTSLLEAMYCNNAIIATPNEGANEVINHNTNGCLIANNTPSLINNKIIDLIQNPVKLQKLSTNAHQYIKNNFSWHESIKKYERGFEKLLVKK